MKNKDIFLKFDSSSEVNFMAGAGEGSIEIEAAEKDDDGKVKARTFKIKAYNGREMFVDNFHLPIVLDLAGMTVTKKARPILMNHNATTPLGHTTNVEISSNKVVVAGVHSFVNEQTTQAVEAAALGFPWQASVGARVTNILRLAEGEEAQANGRTFKGPLLIAKKSQLKEVSFVPLGADDSTSISIAAQESAKKQQEMEFNMNFEKWLKACGLDSSKLSAEQIKGLKAQHALIMEAEASKDEALKAAAEAAAEALKKAKLEASESQSGELDIDELTAKITASVTASVSESLVKAAAIEKLCIDHPEIKAEALKDGWTEQATKNAVELANIKAGRPSAEFSIHAHGGVEVKTGTLEVGLLQAAGVDSKYLVKEYGEETVDASFKQHKGRMGLQEMFVLAAHANGYQGGHNFKSDPINMFRAAMSASLQASAFSTIGLGGILGNAGNKFFIDAFNHIESTWRSVSSVKPVTDFKTNTTYSLTSDLVYKKLAKGGEIESGTFGEEVYTNKADTYARMGGITRQDIINDDLGAFLTVMRKLGNGAAKAFNLAFWTEFMENALPFFSAARKNLLTGNAFDIDELTRMETAFFDQTEPNVDGGDSGDPYGAIPGIILVPNALNTPASQIFNDTLVVIAGDTDTKIPNGNPHAGKYEVVRSSYLSNTNIVGNSTTATYLLSRPSPGGLSMIETVFLQGQETPTIEQGDVDFNQLGIQMRGFHDFGMNKQEYREVVKSAGV